MQERFMQRALELARKGEGRTSPNPAVGAVIVAEDEVVAEGWHVRAGGPHAEIVALRALPARFREDPSRLSLYVTLEPCAHYGKTAPCVDAIIESGIRRVYVGMKDPFVKVSGRGILRLRNAGIFVELRASGSRLAREIRLLNQPYLKQVRTGIPYVIMKAGITLDGKIATSSGESRWITSLKARQDARRERRLCDAVIVGGETVRRDNPVLSGLRIVLSPTLSVPFGAHVFRDKNVLVVCTASSSAVRRAAFERRGIACKVLGARVISIPRLLAYLGRRGVQRIFVEGGGHVHGLFYDAFLRDHRMVDRVVLYQSPTLFGGAARQVVGGRGVRALEDVSSLQKLTYLPLGKDMKISGLFTIY